MNIDYYPPPDNQIKDMNKNPPYSQNQYQETKDSNPNSSQYSNNNLQDWHQQQLLYHLL